MKQTKLDHYFITYFEQQLYNDLTKIQKIDNPSPTENEWNNIISGLRSPNNADREYMKSIILNNQYLFNDDQIKQLSGCSTLWGQINLELKSGDWALKNTIKLEKEEKIVKTYNVELDFNISNKLIDNK